MDSREEGGTMGTSGAMESRDNIELMGTTGVITREPTMAAGGYLGEGAVGMGTNTRTAGWSIWRGVQHGRICVQ